MAGAKRLDDWTRMSIRAAILANSYRNPRRRAKAFTPADFNPYAVKPKPRVATKMDMAMIRDAMEGQRRKVNP